MIELRGGRAVSDGEPVGGGARSRRSNGDRAARGDRSRGARRRHESDVRTGRSAPPLRFWLVWSLRDLRKRWVQVLAIAIVVALGTGTYAGLSASAAWRRVSYDASYPRPTRTTCSCRSPRTRRSTAIRCALRWPPAPHPEWVADLTTSLAVSVQVDASTADETILVPGRMVGLETDRDPTPPVDTLSVTAGRGLGPADTGADVAVLDAGFAAAHDLPATGVLRLGGDEELPWIGTGQSPRYFLAGAETGSLFS